jgi:2'-5' RNA ligase
MQSEKDKYSLWIVPKGEAGNVLQSLASKLAKQYATPFFVPHMTLVANIMANNKEINFIKEQIESLTKQLGSFTVRLADYGYMDEEFRSLYLLAHSSDLANFYDTTSTIFPQVNSEHFKPMPHLSIMYGMYRDDTKQQIISDNPIGPIEFEVDSLDLYLTNDPVTSWKLEQSFELR